MSIPTNLYLDDVNGQWLEEVYSKSRVYQALDDDMKQFLRIWINGFMAGGGSTLISFTDAPSGEAIDALKEMVSWLLSNQEEPMEILMTALVTLTSDAEPPEASQHSGTC